VGVDHLYEKLERNYGGTDERRSQTFGIIRTFKFVYTITINTLVLQQTFIVNTMFNVWKIHINAPLNTQDTPTEVAEVFPRM
jgi:hypothetical protein